MVRFMVVLRWRLRNAEISCLERPRVGGTATKVIIAINPHTSTHFSSNLVDIIIVFDTYMRPVF